jgi:MFS family permease
MALLLVKLVRFKIGNGPLKKSSTDTHRLLLLLRHHWSSTRLVHRALAPRLVGKVYAHRHNGRVDSEARLFLTYPATIILFISLLVLGFALQHQWHYMVLAVFCAVQTFALMIATTAINAYLLDSYPEGSGEVGAWVTAARNWGGFMATYIQLEWVGRDGAAATFGAQAGITMASLVFVLVLQVFGKKIRAMQGRMVFGKGRGM